MIMNIELYGHDVNIYIINKYSPCSSFQILIG